MRQRLANCIFGHEEKSTSGMESNKDGLGSDEDIARPKFAPQTEEAVEFLLWACPDGPVLTAIHPDEKGAIETRTFQPEQMRDGSMRAWIDSWNSERNLYWTVNPVRQAMRKKPSKTDIAELAWLQIDLDPAEGETPEEVLARLNGSRPPGIPEPSCILVSGGGVQAFWRLREPRVLDGTEADAEDAARYNQQLETLFQADHCHNVDRLMRLPGTVNLPNSQKRKKGRVPAPAYVVSKIDVTYPLSDFALIPTESTETHEVSFDSASVTRVANINVLDIPDRLKVVAVKGRLPNKQKDGDDSRSAWLFDFVCNGIRAGVDDQTIYAIITDPGFKISESVLDKGGRAEQYALKQIREAHGEVAKDKADFECNDKGIPYKDSQYNIRVALRKLGVTVRYNEFNDRLLVDGRELTDDQMARLYLETDAHFRFRPGKEFFWMVVEDEARRNPFHPVCDYLDGLQWDSVARIDRWLVTYGGAKDTEYVRAVGRLLLIAAVRRVREPGCKFDEMLVLESPQGELKSTALATLAGNPEWFSDDLPLNADTKVVIERLQGNWIIEAAELKGMKKGDIEHLKASLSRQVDRARMAYGRLPKVVPRQCVIIGTTNSEQYLRDGTGNRRFWPVKVGRFDIEALARDRDQLWAEAATAEAAGELIRLDPRHWAAAGVEQERRRIEDPYVEELARALDGKTGKILASDIWCILDLPAGRRMQVDNERMGEAMRSLGWVRTKRRFGGEPQWCYVKGTKAEQEQHWSVVTMMGGGWSWSDDMSF